jgi:hypothetical protein
MEEPEAPENEEKDESSELKPAVSKPSTVKKEPQSVVKIEERRSSARKDSQILSQ